MVTVETTETGHIKRLLIFHPISGHTRVIVYEFFTENVWKF